MTQNIYDDPTFFEAYSRLPRSVEGLGGAPEWAALRALLPKLKGLRVLDLGCGFGWFCRWAREHGATSVTGVDVSDRMLARARAATHDTAISYAKADLEHLELSPESFDLAYSSLVFHYVENLEGLLASVHAALVAEGKLIFSIEHPIFTAPINPGWLADGAGHNAWALSGYLDEGRRSTDWLIEGVIKQHRTIATYINLLLRSGFAITHVNEWGPGKDQIVAHPEWADERQRPPFLLVASSRSGVSSSGGMSGRID